MANNGGSKAGVNTLSAKSIRELSEILKKVDVNMSPTRVVAAIRSSSNLSGTKLGSGGNIILKSSCGYEAAHTLLALRQIALQASA